MGHVGYANQYETDRNAALTSPEIAYEFVKATNVDCLAVAIGTAHGAYPKNMQPYIDFERLDEIKSVLPIPLVLHGSSGTNIEDLRKVCQKGINKVNIANDLCQAVSYGVQHTNLEGNNAYNFYDVVYTSIKNKLKEMIIIYGSNNKEGYYETI